LREDAKREGRVLGPLHGIPVGIKDVIDTDDMPTENGTVLDAGRRPPADATVVARLRAAGAIILGKTVTTELAVYHPGKTRNPHDAARTPGGSSSGSAAAVAAGMVAAAFGTQTNGSVIRPASFCGVVGFKPTFGLIPRTGILVQSPPLDTVGVFARSIEDAALLVDAVAGHDPRDPDTRLAAAPRLRDIALGEPPVAPAFAFVRSPVWDQAESSTKDAFAELTALLGAAVDEVPLPEPFAHAVPWHRSVMVADLARSYARYYGRGRDRLSATLRGMIEEGQAVTAVDYNNALGGRAALHAGLERLFERFDAILTPAAPGEAPLGLDSTGSPAFCTLWTFLGLPCVTVPLLEGANGLPLGVQLVGPRGGDGRLLRAARWLSDEVLRAGSGRA
jgi:Asp-tRNA(Asn)/Glu-tRNA(Gln) amidotransferase A subunit family amidase